MKDTWLDTTYGLVGQILLGVFSAISEHERKRLQERIQAGIARARREGKSIGRPVVRPPPAAVRPLREAGMSWAEIAAKLGCKPTSVRRAAGRLP